MRDIRDDARVVANCLALAAAIVVAALLIWSCGPTPAPPLPAPPVPVPSPQPEPAPVTTWHPTRAQVLDVKMNFGSYQFDDGTPILEWALPNFPASERSQIFGRIAQYHDTHVMISPYTSYRNYPYDGPTLTPSQLHDLIVDLRDQHHLIPFITLSSGNGGTGTDPDTVWPQYFAALGDVKNDAVFCLGWEVGANAGWS